MTSNVNEYSNDVKLEKCCNRLLLIRELTGCWTYKISGRYE